MLSSIDQTTVQMLSLISSCPEKGTCIAGMTCIAGRTWIPGPATQDQWSFLLCRSCYAGPAMQVFSPAMQVQRKGDDLLRRTHGTMSSYMHSRYRERW
jgi:hypothetical protein